MSSQKIIILKMKNNFFILSILVSAFLFSSCAKKQVPQSVKILSATSAYQLVWQDEFNGTRLDTANWNFETGNSGWGNHEQEYYQAANAKVANGVLKIIAKNLTVSFPYYTSSRITTKGKREFLYGKMEAKIKIPLAQGLWPAFWMLGANIDAVGWPACGETDIMEHINTDSLIYGTMHWDDNEHAQYGGNTSTTPTAWHVYSVEWDSASIRWYVDGIKYWEGNISNNIKSTEEFHKPFFLLLNLAIGGDWPGQVIDDTKLPASMTVDYVRVWQMQ